MYITQWYHYYKANLNTETKKALIKKVHDLTASALFCILKAFPFGIFMLGLRRKRFVSKNTLYRLKKYSEHHTYRPTDLQRAHREAALTVDWLVD